jgi:hypothetical protein
MDGYKVGWSGERHAMRPHPRPESGGWRVPVTACGRIVPAGHGAAPAEGYPPTCVRCRDLARAASLALPGVA